MVLNDLIACRAGSEVANTFKSCKASYEARYRPSLVDSKGSKGGQFTYLNKLVPRAGDNNGVLGVGAEADARNPLGVSLVGDGILAVTEGVPELDCAVARTGHNLAVVGGEGNGQNVVGVADKSSRSVAGGELPQTESLVPRGRQSVGAVRGDDLENGGKNGPVSNFSLISSVVPFFALLFLLFFLHLSNPHFPLSSEEESSISSEDEASRAGISYPENMEGPREGADIRSQRRCVSGRAATAWGIRIATRRGSSSR